MRKPYKTFCKEISRLMGRKGMSQKVRRSTWMIGKDGRRQSCRQRKHCTLS